MKRPTTIRISGIKYKITYDHADPDAFGETDAEKNVISLRNNLPDDKLIRVLVHEITHAVIFETPFSTRKRFDVEEMCDIVGWHFVDALRNNPEVTAYILRELEDNDD